MALLSQTQGTPERVWAAVSILAAHGTSMPREEMHTWLRPRVEEQYDEGRAGADRMAVDQVLQAAGGLGLLTVGRDILELLVPPPRDIDGFGDLVHGLLASMPIGASDADMLDGYACAVVQTELIGSRQWFSDWTAVRTADLLTRSLRPRLVESDDQRFNTTRPAPWKRWLSFIGLNEVFAARTTLLSCTSRLRRELARSDLARDVPLSAEQLLGWIAGRLPYLDGGTLYADACARMGLVHRPTISRVLSSALRDLHEDGVIRLASPRGDAQGGMRLSADPLAGIHQFNSVMLIEGADV